MPEELPRASCVFVVRNGKVLSVSRPEDESAFALPGGRNEPGEKDRTTAAREAWEETGIVVSGLSVLYEGECDGHWCTTFLVSNFFGEPRNMGEGLVSWVYPEALFTGGYGEFNKKVVDAWRKIDRSS
jgi:8-oxo-dGTP pyrophosphatase MutT (NUDIX family)